MVETKPRARDSEALQLANDATEILSRQRQSVSHFLTVSADGRRTVLQKWENAGPLDEGDPTDGATTTAFAVSRLSRSAAKANSGSTSATPQGVTQEEWRDLASTIARDFVSNYKAGDSAVGDKDAGDMPNRYSTPIHLSGLLATLDDQPSTELVQAIDRVVHIISDWLLLVPFVSREDLSNEPDPAGGSESEDVDALVSLADGSPNWYLTYLMVDALATFVEVLPQHNHGTIKRARRALNRARAASLLGLSRMIALSSAGLSGIYDALDLGGCLAVVGRGVAATCRSDLITSRLIAKGLKLLGTDFLTAYGAFAPKGPAMVDRSKELVEISSSELAEAVLSSLSAFLDDDQTSVLFPAIRLTCQRADGHRGWGESNQGGVDRRDLFVASSSIALLSEFTARTDQNCHRQASEALDVEPAPDMGSLDYPGAIKLVVEQKVIAPIKAGRRDLAAMSLLLYGPPGTAKTTIARKIAADLGWPILELTPSRLLLTGFEEITSRAEDLFGLLSDLRDVVVLFDEFEGFIGRRDVDGASDASKFLTTFMLPKLHRLRDSGQVVFVVATNDDSAIDSAASRPGRIDTKLKVSPPEVDEVRQVILASAKRVSPLNGSRDEWLKVWQQISQDSTADSIRGLTYGYINRWIKDVALEFNTSYTFDSAQDRLNELRRRLQSEQSAEGD